MKVIYVNGMRFTDFETKLHTFAKRAPEYSIRLYDPNNPFSRVLHTTVRVPAQPDTLEAGFRHVAQSGRTFEVTEE